MRRVMAALLLCCCLLILCPAVLADPAQTPETETGEIPEDAAPEEIPVPKIGFSHETLCCHYCIRRAADSVAFTLWRTPEDNKALLQKAEGLGVVGGVGLFQEWQRMTDVISRSP